MSNPCTRHHLALALFLMGALLLPTTVLAKDGPPVSVTILGEPRSPEPGEIFTGEFLIETGEAGSIEGLRLSGKGWSAGKLDSPAIQETGKSPSGGMTAKVAFSVLAFDPNQPLEFSFEWNGHEIREAMDLSPAGVRRAAGMRVVPAPVGGATALPIPDERRSFLIEEDPSLDDPAPDNPEDVAARQAAGAPALGDEASSQPAKDYNITVSGRFVYMRTNNDGTQTKIGADAMVVKVYDAMFGIDDHLQTTITDTNGYYNTTFTWTRWSDPDLYVEFHAENAEVEVEHPIWGYTYVWESHTVENYTGTNLDFGELMSAEEGMHGAVHGLNCVTRAARWMIDESYNSRDVRVEWPDGGDTRYTHINHTIHITEARTWRDDSYCHEYGHHWMHEWGDPVTPAYCNGICDESALKCGHCIWCEENLHDAWNEGFPNYLGWVIPNGFQSLYGIASENIRDLEALDTCGEDSLWDDPLITEGFVSAVLQDIHDSTDEDDPHFPGWSDELTMGANEILRVANLDDHWSVMDFLRLYRDEYPAVKEDLWETAQNNGYELDESNPLAVTALASTSHPIGVESSNPTPLIFWITADDDCAGIDGYSVLITTSGPSRPNQTQEIGDVQAYLVPELGPGSYWFNIRAQDRAGNWSDSYASYGPMVIRDREPSDLRFATATGWDYSVVPTDSPTHTALNAPVSDFLTGNSLDTYYSVLGINSGEQATSSSFTGRIHVDGVNKGGSSWGAVPAGTGLFAVNVGPIYVNTGRHLLVYKLDAGDDILEVSEVNNWWGRQFVWTPYETTPGTQVLHTGISWAGSGWDEAPSGTLLGPNCHGFRFQSSGWWNAFALWSGNHSENYDARLHDPSTGAEDGFFGLREHSGRGAGCLDAIIVNRNVEGSVDWDVGVADLWDSSMAGYRVLHIESTQKVPGLTYEEPMGLNDHISLNEYHIEADEVGPITVMVETIPPTSPVYVQWRDQDYGFGNLTDAAFETVTGADGEALLQFDVTEVGYNNLAFFHDPKDDLGSFTVRFTVGPTPPDLEPYYWVGWHSPFTPRSDADGTPASCPLPATLIGNSNTTYDNIALINDSPADATSLHVHTYLDGVGRAGLNYSNFPGYANSRYNWSTSYTVRGGRHTVSMWIDSPETIDESSETNNIYGEQYIWTPGQISPLSRHSRAIPPERTGGWDEIRSGEARWFNSDGLRLNDKGDMWIGLATMSGPNSNVDIRLHQPSRDSKDGFAQNEAYSGWGVGKSDFVLVNYNLAPRADYDAGCLKIEGTENYYVHCEKEVSLGIPDGTYGPYTLDTNQIFDLYELRLAADTYLFELIVRGDPVDWGISLHPNDDPFMTKSDVVPNAAQWMRGAGMGEFFSVTLAEAGYYALAVWKVGDADLALSGEYQLRITRGATGIDDAPSTPRVTAFHGAYPNPFNPRTTLAFDLAKPGQVELTIYNLAGARVRTVLREQRPAGSYKIPWDGRDDGGRRVASGTYLARMRAGEVNQVKKMVLLK